VGSLQRAYGEEEHPPPVDRSIARVARRQSGVISTAQLIECGLTKDGIASRVRRGHLHSVLRSVYAVGHTNLTRRGREWAVVLACGPDASLSHNTAGALFVVVPAERRLHVTTSRSRHARQGFTVHRTRNLDPADRTTIDGLSVTTLHRTLIDLADVLPEKRLTKAIHEAEVRRLFDLSKLDEALRRAPGRCTSRASRDPGTRARSSSCRGS